MYAALPEFFGINYTVIGFIRCAESRKLIRVCRPVEIAGIHDRTAQRHRMTVHIFGGGMRYDTTPHLNGLQLIGVGNVLSTINGT